MEDRPNAVDEPSKMRPGNRSPELAIGASLRAESLIVESPIDRESEEENGNNLNRQLFCRALL